MGAEKVFLWILLVVVITIGFIVRPQASNSSTQLSQATAHQSLDREVSF